MKKIILLFFVLNSSVFGQRADFFQENITFRLDGANLNVEGYYWFSNYSDKPVNSDLFYPFHYNSGEQIDSIQIFNISAGQKTGFKNEGKYGISFILHIAAFDTVLFQIKYRQKLNADSAVYILKSTQAWGKPLNYAEFKLVTPESLLIKNFSYPPDKFYEFEKVRVYYWKRENFMPVKDMIFYF